MVRNAPRSPRRPTDRRSAGTSRAVSTTAAATIVGTHPSHRARGRDAGQSIQRSCPSAIAAIRPAAAPQASSTDVMLPMNVHHRPSRNAHQAAISAMWARRMSTSVPRACPVRSVERLTPAGGQAVSAGYGATHDDARAEPLEPEVVLVAANELESGAQRRHDLDEAVPGIEG